MDTMRDSVKGFACISKKKWRFGRVLLIPQRQQNTGLLSLYKVQGLSWVTQKSAGFKIKTVLSNIRTFGIGMINTIWFFMENAG